MGVSAGSTVDSAVRGGVERGSAVHDFDAIVGASIARGAAPAAPDADFAGDAARRSTSRSPRRAATRARALVTFGVLSAAGVALGASVIVSVEVSQNPLTRGAPVLSGEKLAASAKTAPADPRVPFGATTALGSELAVGVSDPIAYSPSPKAVGVGGGVAVVSTVTLTNLGSGPVQPGLGFAVEDTTGTRIFDAPGGILLEATRSLQPGESATYRVAFSVADLPKLALRVSSGDDTVVIGR
ncbi:MAG: hypothetical protein HY996_09895 [Micrococcales bacterium]|nr:hypothetical protein [Micrococcales bacterium]